MAIERIPDPVRRICKLKNKEICIITKRKQGDDYCPASDACDREECKYKGGTVDPF